MDIKTELQSLVKYNYVNTEKAKSLGKQLIESKSPNHILRKNIR
jgi:hypothetical protein